MQYRVSFLPTDSQVPLTNSCSSPVSVNMHDLYTPQSEVESEKESNIYLGVLVFPISASQTILMEKKETYKIFFPVMYS